MSTRAKSIAAATLGVVFVALCAVRADGFAIEPRCVDDARRYDDVTRRALTTRATCADIARGAEALEALGASTCGAVGARARFLAAKLNAATGAWDDAKRALAGDETSELWKTIDEMSRAARVGSEAGRRGDWVKAYAAANAAVEASACALDPRTFQARARAALKLAMHGRAFVDAKRALALGGGKSEAYETMATALSELADSAERLADAETLARRCLRYSPDNVECLVVRKNIRRALLVWREASDAESLGDWSSAIDALRELRNATRGGAFEALKFDALVASCRVNGKRERARWETSTTRKRVPAKLVADAIDQCTDALSELMSRGGESRVDDVPNSYYARAWMRALSANVDGAMADVAGIERSVDVSSDDWKANVEALRKAIEEAREANAPKDLYAILGLTREDAQAEDWLRVLKRAYRKLALLLHPDKNPAVDKEEAEEKFDELVKAYKILSSETLRREYDETGKVNLGVDAQATNDWFDSHADSRRTNDGQPPNDGFNEDDYIFRFDKRDAGADGRAAGQYVHKETGERVFGERDVRPEEDQQDDVCVKKKGYCIAGRGGAEAPSRAKHVPGVESLEVKIVTPNLLPGDTVAARLVRNIFGLHKLEFIFAFDVELPSEEVREKTFQDAAKTRLRRLVRTLHASLVGREGASTLTSMIEEHIVSSSSSEDDSIVDYVASAMSGRAPRVGSPHETRDLLDRFASRATREMRRLGALGLNSDDRTDNFVRVARDLMFNPLVSSHLLSSTADDAEDASQVRSLVALWRDDVPSRVLVDGDVLSYEIKFVDSDKSPDAVRAMCATLDFETTAGDRLSAFPDAIDQFGLAAAVAAVNFRDVLARDAVNGWISRRIPIPSGLIGARVSSWFIVAARIDAGRASTRVREVKIINAFADADDFAILEPRGP